jgi:hypothetical protein
MKVIDITGQSDVQTCDELYTVLRRRWTNNDNAFILSFQDREFPQLLLHVKGELAFAYYLPGGHAGFISRGSSGAPVRADEVSFTISAAGDQIEVMRISVIPVSAMLAAAQEFFASDGKLPGCIAWQEL